VTSVPDNEIKRRAMVAVLKKSLEGSCNDDSADVVIKFIGSTQIDRTIHTESKADFMKYLTVRFDVLKKIRCDSDNNCQNALDAVAWMASAINDELQSAMTDGSFTSSLQLNALEAGVEALENVSVDSTSFLSQEPTVEVVSLSPTSAPIISGTSASPLIALIQAVIDALYAFIDFIMSLSFRA